MPPITIQPVENCAVDSNPRRPAPAENVRRITTPPAAEKTPPVLEQTAQFEEKILFSFLKGVCYNRGCATIEIKIGALCEGGSAKRGNKNDNV